MAKQNRPIIWEVTIGFISFYKRCGVGCVRMKSNLTAERWRTDPAFEGSRLSAACMALASQLASSCYQTIPQQQRRYPHYKQLVGIAQHMLCQGYNIQQVNRVLHFTVSRYLRKLQNAADRKPVRSPFAATLSLKAKPAFTPMASHLLTVPRFTTHQLTVPRSAAHQSTVPRFTAITASRSTFRLWPVIIPPRGSPTATTTGCTRKTGTPSAGACHLSENTLPVAPAIPNGRACYVPTRQSSSPIPKTAPKTIHQTQASHS